MEHQRLLAELAVLQDDEQLSLATRRFESFRWSWRLTSGCAFPLDWIGLDWIAIFFIPI